MTKAKGKTVVAVPMLDPKGKLSEELAKELAADGEESAADVLKNRGWVPQEGPCVALLAEIKENKVIGMKMATFSGLTEGRSSRCSRCDQGGVRVLVSLGSSCKEPIW